MPDGDHAFDRQNAAENTMIQVSAIAHAAR
jgi:hypothetical protein